MGEVYHGPEPLHADAAKGARGADFAAWVARRRPKKNEK
jgi:hypothetical protein